MAASISYLGHATILLDLPHGRLLTDPVLRGHVGYLRRIAPAIELAAVLPVAALLVSHVHHDHLDGPSLRRVGTARPVVAPRGARRLLRIKGMLDVVELAEGEIAGFAGVSVTATPAAHDVTRLPGGRRVPALGYVIDDGIRIYFAGDTDLFDEMEQIGDAGIDVALLPVAGWGPRLPPGHMDAARAALALTLLRPRIAIPIHWGTIAPMWWRVPAPAVARAPAEDFAREANVVAPDVDVRILDPGDTLRLEEGGAHHSRRRGDTIAEHDQR